MKQSWECHASPQTVPNKADPQRGGWGSVLLSAVLVFTCLGIYKGLQERFFFLSFSAHKTFDLRKFVEDKAGVVVSRVLKRKSSGPCKRAAGSLRI